MTNYLNNNTNVLSNFKVSASIPNGSTINTGYIVKHTNGNPYDIAKIYDNNDVIPNMDSNLITNYSTNINSTKYDIGKILFNNDYNHSFGRTIHTNRLHKNGINSVEGEVKIMVLLGSDIYVGGKFTLVYDSKKTQYANNIAKYNTISSTWSLIGTTLTGTPTNNGTNGTVNTIAILDSNNIYVGGNFTSVYDSTTKNVGYIAKYNGTSWSLLGNSGSPTNNGTSGTVNTIAILDSTNIYVGGDFTSVYDSTTKSANRIAKYNGTSWSLVGTTATGSPTNNGTSGIVNTIAILNSTNIYVGGVFTSVYDSTTTPTKNANYIAKYNGTSWSLLGTTLTGSPTNNGTNGTVHTIAILNSTNIYIGGSFRTVYYTSAVTPLLYTANRIVKYNGTSWSLVGTNSTPGTMNNNGTSSTVNTIVILDSTNIYVGGNFTSVNDSAVKNARRIAKYNGTSWSLLGNNGIYTISGIADGTVYTFAYDSISNELYVGGNFINMLYDTKTISSYNIGVLNITASMWTTMGTNGQITKVIKDPYDSNSVYVGGLFSVVYDKTGIKFANNIAKYNLITSTWSLLGTPTNNGLDGGVSSMMIINNDMYISGSFQFITNPVTQWANCIIKYNLILSTWSLLGTTSPGTSTNNGAGNTIRTMALLGTDIYVGGLFEVVYDSTGTKNANHIAKYDTINSTWSLLGTNTAGSLTDNGANDEVLTIVILGTDIYVGGYFTRVHDTRGSIIANRIAKYDTINSTWSLVGTTLTGSDTNNGTNSSVNTIAVLGTDIYVGGDFTSVYDSTTTPTKNANYIAKYDTINSTWSLVGTNSPGSDTNNGTNRWIYKITIIDSDIYVGGSFGEVYDDINGTQYAKGIAKYNGGKWSIIGQKSNATNYIFGSNIKLVGFGTNNWVNTIDLVGCYIYVGGSFGTWYNGMINDDVDGRIVRYIYIL